MVKSSGPRQGLKEGSEYGGTGRVGLWQLTIGVVWNEHIHHSFTVWMGEIPTCMSVIKYVTLIHEMSYVSHILK